MQQWGQKWEQDGAWEAKSNKRAGKEKWKEGGKDIKTET